MTTLAHVQCPDCGEGPVSGPTISLATLLASYSPESHGNGWTWEDETADLLAADCYCTSAPEVNDGVVVIGDPCGTPGHYQLRLEERIRADGSVTEPICLGTDGRVWDGHHRVVAAIRLGFDRLPVDELPAALVLCLAGQP